MRTGGIMSRELPLVMVSHNASSSAQMVPEYWVKQSRRPVPSDLFSNDLIKPPLVLTWGEIRGVANFPVISKRNPDASIHAGMTTRTLMVSGGGMS